MCISITFECRFVGSAAGDLFSLLFQYKEECNRRLRRNSGKVDPSSAIKPGQRNENCILAFIQSVHKI